ncbi:Phosphatidylinositol transfer protein [Carpediemonas membranifera]|uniref:Phosphatidylinositol transfer protein n=1 Tax=Carpediemonas membranifera TaxID=201153 RepID=A0A8J6EAI3_9EUKA|nr:Phosphatidylinositol transfer protein [Carpediemonas membranifera]|eukprot:KAG9394735.1 Phosphatidylinositol transfer protein [Carpediemonas membranifera]
MKVTEYRLPMPFTPEQYQIGQLYMCSRGSAEDSTGDDGIEFVENKPLTKDGRSGQYTKKIFHITTYLPKWMQAVIPKGAFDVIEESHNCFPFIQTSYHAPFLKERFELVITSMHVADDDCKQDNPLGMPAEDLKLREIDEIDIVNDELTGKDYEPEFDPTTQATPLGPKWREEREPIMTAYKSLKVKLAIFGIQGKAEKFIASTVRTVFLKYHRKCYAWYPEWKDLTIEDIRKFEAEAAAKLKELHST